jgi:hypothetical protein
MTTTPDPRDEPVRTPAEAPTRPSSPGPDPDDINQDDPRHLEHQAERASGAVGAGTEAVPGTPSGAPGAARPTSPGPDPEDVDR